MSKIAVISGGSRGIGKETALLLSKNGYDVYELSRGGVSENGITHITCDVTSEKDVQAAIEGLSKIDLLVCNAGFGISGAATDTDLEAAKRQFDVNFFGAVCLSKYAVQKMSAGSRIIFISSVAAVTPVPFQAFYSASKAAINSYAYSLANELRPLKISVCAVMPGDTKTDFTAKREKLASSQSFEERLSRSVSSMEKSEQNGMSASSVAKVVLHLSKKRRVKPVYAVGFLYKTLSVMAKLLPSRLVNYILYLLYAK